MKESSSGGYAIKNIENIKPKHTDKNLKRQQELEAINRRTFVKRFGAAAIGFATFCAAWQMTFIGGQDLVISSASAASKPAITQTYENNPIYKQTLDQERRMQSVLTQTDQAILSLYEKLSFNLKDSSAQEQVFYLTPLTIYETNKDNGYRNKYSILRENIEARGERALLQPIRMYPGKTEHFYFEFLVNRQDVEAGFSPVSRTLLIKEGFDSSNLMDLAVLYHEVEHMKQDTEVRKTVFSPDARSKYERFYTTAPGSKPRLVESEEQLAYFKEIQVLNILTDGQFKRDVLSGQVDIPHYIQTLNAKPEQEGTLALIAEMAQLVFSTDSDITFIPQPFKDYVNRMHEDLGYDLHKSM